MQPAKREDRSRPRNTEGDRCLRQAFFGEEDNPAPRRHWSITFSRERQRTDNEDIDEAEEGDKFRHFRKALPERRVMGGASSHPATPHPTETDPSSRTLRGRLRTAAALQGSDFDQANRLPQQQQQDPLDAPVIQEAIAASLPRLGEQQNVSSSSNTPHFRDKLQTGEPCNGSQRSKSFLDINVDEPSALETHRPRQMKRQDNAGTRIASVVSGERGGASNGTTASFTEETVQALQVRREAVPESGIEQDTNSAGVIPWRRGQTVSGWQRNNGRSEANPTQMDETRVTMPGPFCHLPGAANRNREETETVSSTNRKRQAADSSSKQKLCIPFQKGSCPFGNHCTHKHASSNYSSQPQKPCFRFEKTGNCQFEDRCKYAHDRPGLTAQAKHCISVYKQFMQDESLYFRHINQAVLFVTGMSEAFQNKRPELLMVLTAPGGKGLKRLRSVISMCETAQHLDITCLGIVDVLLCDELSVPLYTARRGDLLMDLFNTPCLFELLLGSISQLQKTETLCRFLLELCRQFLEARHSEKVLKLAAALREIGCSTSSRLCSYIVLKKEKVNEEESGPAVPQVPVWEKDALPPGTRHDNDFLNFRDISIIPTVDEISGEGAQAAPYLPLHSGDNSFLHEDPETSYLDSTFRLYREDMVRSIREEFAGQKRRWNCSSVMGLDCGIDRSVDGRVTRKPSLIFRLEVPDRMEKLSKRQREKLWKHSKSLQKGSLVCLCASDGDPEDEELRPISFGTIVTRDIALLCNDDGPFLGIMFNRIEDIVERISDIGANKNKLLSIIEARCSFFSYESVLRRLQSMESVPFGEELVHSVRHTTRPSHMPDEVRLPSDFGISDKIALDSEGSFLESVTTHTTLNPSQAKALFLGLKSRVSLIHGPPGTGKSFVGSVIVRTILENSDAKILCVCYTNHALDQMLEDLLEKGVKNLVRIGGCSKSKVLQQHSVWEFAKRRHAEGISSANDRRAKAVLHNELKDLSERIDELQQTLGEKLSWNGEWGIRLQAFLREFRPRMYSELKTETVDEEGFQSVGKGGKHIANDFRWQKWSNGSRRPGYGLKKRDEAMWDLDLSQRQTLLEEWRLAVTADTREELSLCFRSFLRRQQSLKELRDSTAYKVVKEARVIGATTTGVAIHKNLIDHAAAEVIIVEEAGEILEAHTLSSLNKKVQHMVLIGDHKQLRPKVESYSLTAVSGNGYGLDISLFERLILNPNMESAMLQVQHRMRTEFSDLLRMQTYPTLEDAESTLTRPHTRGIRNDLLFLTHSVPESKPSAGLGESTSKTNIYEAELAIEVVRLILLQGYKPEQMVVLTPYLGQLRVLEQVMSANIPEVMALVDDNDLEDLEKQFRNEELLLENTEGNETTLFGKEIRMEDWRAKSSLRSIRVATIDNFQGEEADIVVISLVRSNERGQIGFLSDAKRVNVLFSRARNSMFVIGNMETFRVSKAGKELWTPLLEKLENDGNLMPHLESYCDQHPEDVAYLQDPESFRKLRPNGGCLRQCLFRMSCGHACPLRCHPVDPRHNRIKCHEPCLRRPSGCERGHSCPKECSQDCGLCTAEVEATLPCGHNKMVECYAAHDNRMLGLIRCSEPVIHQSFTICDHKDVTMKCQESKSDQPNCPMPCPQLFACGHLCSSRCGKCSKRERHESCREKCERVLFCGHICGQPCHDGPCQKCNRKCEIRCYHSKCPNECHEHCAPCMEPCVWSCVHEGKCEVICGAPCVRKRCDQRCENLLKCGHRCPSVCGETCPPESFCQICANAAKKRTVVDMVMLATYEQHESLDSDPIIVLPCNHFYCMSTLDGVMELDSEGFTSEGMPMTTPKSCPECRKVIHSVFRYGSVQKYAELSLLQRKHTMDCERRLRRAIDESGSFKVEVNLKRLTKLLSDVKRSPMLYVYEAVANDKRHGSWRPRDHRLQIEVLTELARHSLLEISSVSEDDSMYMRTRDTLTEAIRLADSSSSHRSGAKARILLAEAFIAETKLREQVIARNPFYLAREEEAIASCEWIIGSKSGDAPQEVLRRAHELVPIISSKSRLEMERQERLAVRRAIDSSFVSLADGGANAHWYQCAEGHEYFIGECGMPTREARCPECGLRIGGRNHTLVAGNQHSNMD